MSDYLLEFTPGNEIRIPDPSIPLTLAIVITKFQNRTLLLYSPERQVWEAPGGGGSVLVQPERPPASRIPGETTTAQSGSGTITR